MSERKHVQTDERFHWNEILMGNNLIYIHFEPLAYKNAKRREEFYKEKGYEVVIKKVNDINKKH